MVLEDHQKGIPTDDTRLRPRRVYQALMAGRNSVILKTKSSSTSYRTFISCLPLVKTTFHECDCVPISGCTIYKADCNLGESAESTMTVTTLKGDLLSRVSWDRVSSIEHERYTKHIPRWFFRNGRIYVINPGVSYIAVDGIINDPILASSCGCSSSSSTCASPMDVEFPFDQRYLSEIIMRAKEILFGINTEEDKKNDKKEDA